MTDGFCPTCKHVNHLHGVSGPGLDPCSCCDEEHPAKRALRVHVPTSDDPDEAFCVFDGERWPCPTAELAQELLERYP